MYNVCLRDLVRKSFMQKYTRVCMCWFRDPISIVLQWCSHMYIFLHRHTNTYMHKCMHADLHPDPLSRDAPHTNAYIHRHKLIHAGYAPRTNAYLQTRTHTRRSCTTHTHIQTHTHARRFLFQTLIHTTQQACTNAHIHTRRYSSQTLIHVMHHTCGAKNEHASQFST